MCSMPAADIARKSRGIENRKHPRFDVHLGVRYFSARDYVEEYAYNLSQGGLFVAGAEFEPMQTVSVELELPGYGHYTVQTRVAYVLGAEEAIKRNRKPGAGLAITAAPPGFDRSLKQYLMILGRRRDCHVLVVGDQIARLLAAAGYRVCDAPPPGMVASAILNTARVVGLVVPHRDLLGYRTALDGADLPTDLVIGTEEKEASSTLLTVLDRRVAAVTGGAGAKTT